MNRLTNIFASRFWGLVTALSMLVSPLGSKVLCVSASGDHVAIEDGYSADNCEWSKSAKKDDCDDDSSGCVDFEISDSALLNSDVSDQSLEKVSKNHHAHTLISQPRSFNQLALASLELSSISDESVQKFLHYLAIRSVIFLN